MQMEVYNPEHFSEKTLSDLGQPLNESQIKERKGGNGKMLKYLKTDTVIDTANHIFGFGKWGYKVLARDHQVVEDPRKGGPIHMYTADIELSVIGCPFTFPGDGVGIVTEPFTVEIHEKARKEATSDALKRALRHYGDQFGLCLYNEDDMIEGADGNMKSVKEAKQQKPVPAKHVVESEKPALPDVIKKRLNDLFPQAKALKLFEAGKNDKEALANFFKLITALSGESVTSPLHITVKHLDSLESHIKQVSEAR